MWFLGVGPEEVIFSQICYCLRGRLECGMARSDYFSRSGQQLWSSCGGNDSGRHDITYLHPNSGDEVN